MESKTDNIDAQVTTPREGSGSLLAAARKKQNKSVEEIAAELNLSITQIKTIELDQSEGLPEPTYVRGYIRSYARLLGLDAEQVLKNYLNPNWQKSSSLDEIPKGIANADEIKGKGFFTLGKVVAIFLLFSVVAFLWFSGLFSSFDSPDAGGNEPTLQVEKPLLNSSIVSAESATKLESKSEASSEPSSSVSSNENSVSESADGAQLTTGVNQQNSEDDTQSVASSDENKAVNNEPKEAHNLVLNFVETCWVDIRDSNDKRLAYKSYYAGDELSVSNDERLIVFLGNADGVKATYNGEPFDMSSYREGVYAKFSLGKN